MAQFNIGFTSEIIDLYSGVKSPVCIKFSNNVEITHEFQFEFKSLSDVELHCRYLHSKGLLGAVHIDVDSVTREMLYFRRSKKFIHLDACSPQPGAVPADAKAVHGVIRELQMFDTHHMTASLSLLAIKLMCNEAGVGLHISASIVSNIRGSYTPAPFPEIVKDDIYGEVLWNA